MSELTTGAVSISLIGAPLAIGAACAGAIHFAGKYCLEHYEKLIDEIEKSNDRLKWLDKQVVSSPSQIKEEALRLQKMVASAPSFLKMTTSISVHQKDILAGAIATQHSPLKGYVLPILQDIPETESSFETAINRGIKELAVDNLRFVTKVVGDAAQSSGFTKDIKLLKQSDGISDIVFIDSQNRRLSAFCKLDKQLNPSIALDLEGFRPDSEECSVKMTEIVSYLHEHGVPFTFKRLKHNQPMGVLRKLLNKKEAESKDKEMHEYLHYKDNKMTVKSKIQ